MENTYYSSAKDNKDKITAIVMAIVAIAIGIGIITYYTYRVISLGSAFKLIGSLFEWSNGDIERETFSFLLSLFLWIVLLIFYAVPATTIIIGLIVLITRGRKKSISIALYIFMGLMILIFARTIFK